MMKHYKWEFICTARCFGQENPARAVARLAGRIIAVHKNSDFQPAILNS
jgi:hypothetical protein